jgi:hypothetical protein
MTRIALSAVSNLDVGSASCTYRRKLNDIQSDLVNISLYIVMTQLGIITNLCALSQLISEGVKYKICGDENVFKLLIMKLAGRD